MKNLIIILLLLGVNICAAQEDILNESPPQIVGKNPRKDDVRYKLTYLITKNAANKYALIEGPANAAYLFSITLSFDANGKVDGVYYSKNRPKNVTEMLSLNSALVEKIKALDMEYKQYASKLVLVPFFYYRLGSNVLDYKSGFLKSIESLLPEEDDHLTKKSWIILDTMINTFGVVN